MILCRPSLAARAIPIFNVRTRLGAPQATLSVEGNPPTVEPRTVPVTVLQSIVRMGVSYPRVEGLVSQAHRTRCHKFPVTIDQCVESYCTDRNVQQLGGPCSPTDFYIRSLCGSNIGCSYTDYTCGGLDTYCTADDGTSTGPSASCRPGRE